MGKMRVIKNNDTPPSQASCVIRAGLAAGTPFNTAARPSSGGRVKAAGRRPMRSFG